MKVKIIANNIEWKTWDEKLKKLKDWFSPKVSLEFEIINTSFEEIPFEDYVDNMIGVDRNWYDKHISPYGFGSSILLLVLNKKQWKSRKARGWKTDGDYGAIELQIGVNEKDHLKDKGIPPDDAFYLLARHEIMHALFMISGQYDTTHYYWDLGQFERARDSLVIPQNYTFPILTRAINFLTKQFNSITINLPQPTYLGETIYQKALSSLGMDVSPKDLASDELGCAESVTTLLNSLFQDVPIITGTWSLLEFLKKSKNFSEVETPTAGDIIVYATGTGNGTIPGHTGIIGKEGKVMSNDSSTGLFLENYTLQSMKERYELKGGFKKHIYRRNY